jgi:hypothetical protein
MAKRKGGDPAPLGITSSTERVLCITHGVELRHDGWCPLGQAYATNAPCPFVCPVCRGPLDWVGGCVKCHGCTTGNKEDWTFPGDRYERDDDNPGHYRLTDLKAGRPSCTPRENIAAMQIVQAVLAKKMTVKEAEGHLAVIFNGRERLDLGRER